MTDIVPQARIANASIRKTLGTLLGTPSTTVAVGTSASDHRSGNNGDISDRADFFRQERQEMTLAWQEASDETAGVGAIISDRALPHDSKTGNPLTVKSGISKDEENLRRRMLGSKGHTKSKVSSASSNGVKENVLGKRGRFSGASSRRNDEEESSDEEEGRAALGKSRLNSRAKGMKKVEKYVAEIETFDSMQRSSQQEDEEPVHVLEHGNVEDDLPKQPNIKTSRLRHKNYLDELLEVKESKRRKKEMKKKNGDSQAG